MNKENYFTKTIVIITFCALFITISCTETVSKSAKVEKNTVQAQKVLKAGKKEIPVMNFDQLNKLLYTTNDTTYVVNFWATWCAPCVKELPHFEKLGQAYIDKKVRVLLVSLDFPKKAESQLVPYVIKNKIENEVILLDDPDMNTWIPKVAEDWSGAIPATLIFNKGKRSFFEETFTYEALEETLIKTMN